MKASASIKTSGPYGRAHGTWDSNAKCVLRRVAGVVTTHRTSKCLCFPNKTEQNHPMERQAFLESRWQDFRARQTTGGVSVLSNLRASRLSAMHSKVPQEP